MKISLKRAAEKDWENVSFFEKSVSESKYYSAVTKENEVKEYIKKSHVFLILKDNKPVGTISYEMKDKNHAYLDGLTVHPDYQKQGIAKKSIEILMSELKGIRLITLVVHPKNTPAIVLYLKHGFYINGWKDNYFGDGEPRIEMSKENS
ncbi:MAG: GNAT family N-acetyltransferase [Candidatus Nanoarchaeia archaeon]|nr:GNAT family N-acetyltransferase [Candidatus Nanoarchaeia archaeon]MDD5238884.1 GNAT family N-acetyltransferase [Candidatus Nanoarchaeia archaeon]